MDGVARASQKTARSKFEMTAIFLLFIRIIRISKHYIEGNPDLVLASHIDCRWATYMPRWGPFRDFALRFTGLCSIWQRRALHEQVVMILISRKVIETLGLQLILLFISAERRRSSKWRNDPSPTRGSVWGIQRLLSLIDVLQGQNWGMSRQHFRPAASENVQESDTRIARGWVCMFVGSGIGPYWLSIPRFQYRHPHSVNLSYHISCMSVLRRSQVTLTASRAKMPKSNLNIPMVVGVLELSKLSWRDWSARPVREALPFL